MKRRELSGSDAAVPQPPLIVSVNDQQQINVESSCLVAITGDGITLSQSARALSDQMLGALFVDD